MERTGPFWDVMEGRKPPPPAAVTLGFKLLEIDPGRGTIRVQTGHDGDHVWVEIADSGPGIPPEAQARIFDPFFTTKPVGKGTGLGLSISYGIVAKHHGRIDVDSRIGEGSRFRIVLPVRQPQATVEAV